ncbi:MAG: CoA transferase, partial [Acidimicrobiia bacterium]|nr:CoA transferase [Acidimicrobiia bacterium]
ERFRSLEQRAANGDVINGIVEKWTSGLPASDIEARCVEHDVPVATAYTAADIATDPHMQARGDLVTVDDAVVGPMKQQAPYPRFDGSPPPVPAGAPLLGEHNEDVWCGLVGLSDDELAGYRAGGVI